MQGCCVFFFVVFLDLIVESTQRGPMQAMLLPEIKSKFLCKIAPRLEQAYPKNSIR